jgi:hypothetical protein
MEDKHGMNTPEVKHTSTKMSIPEDKHDGEGMYTPEVKHIGEAISPAEVKHDGEGMYTPEVKHIGEGISPAEVKQVGEEMRKLGVKQVGEETEPDGGRAGDEKTTDKSVEPFCCQKIVSYKAIRTAHNDLFNNFLKASGDAPNNVFEVIRQVDNGPILFTKYFALLKDAVVEVALPAGARRVNTFKNFKCVEHDLFFSVNLYSTTVTPVPIHKDE